MNQSKKFFLLTLLLITGSMFGMLSKASRLTQLTKKLRFTSPNLRKNAQRFLATRRKNRTNLWFNAPGNHYQVAQHSLPALIQKRLLRNRVPNDQVVKNNAQGIQKFLTTHHQPRTNALIATQDNYKQTTKNMLPILLQKRLMHNENKNSDEKEKKMSFLEAFAVSSVALAGTGAFLFFWIGGFGLMLDAHSPLEFLMGFLSTSAAGAGMIKLFLSDSNSEKIKNDKDDDSSAIIATNCATVATNCDTATDD